MTTITLTVQVQTQSSRAETRKLHRIIKSELTATALSIDGVHATQFVSLISWSPKSKESFANELDSEERARCSYCVKMLHGVCKRCGRRCPCFEKDKSKKDTTKRRRALAPGARAMLDDAMGFAAGSKGSMR